MSRNDTPERERLYLAVDSFHAVGMHGEPIFVQRGTRWRGPFAEKYSSHMVPADADEHEIAAARNAVSYFE
jgi:hypothetical protein